MSLNTVRGVNNIGAADAVTKAYIRKNEVFADAFNYFMYDGEQKIQPDQLRELDTTEIAILLNEKDTKDNKDTKDRKYNKDNNASESKLEKFHASLREVIGCIKYSNDKNKLAEFIYDNPRMNMEVEAARVIETITSVTIEKEEVDSMGNVNMCKAIQEMMQDSRDEGRLAGLTEGRLQLLTTLIQSGKVTVKEAATLMDMTQEEFLAKSKTIS